jgi:OmpA-OmpF porin, OOP family
MKLALFLTAILAHGLTASVALAEDVISADEILNQLNNKFTVETDTKAETTVPAPAGQTAAVATPKVEALGQLDLTIQFARNSAVIETASFAQLVNLSQAIADPRMGQQRVLIAGHTDARGSDEHNLLLSQRRAAAVKEFLSSLKPDISGRLETIGFGESRLKNQTDPEGAENRRVQIVNLGQ